MIQLCHYTDDERAEKIIRSGRIMASLQTSGDAVFGNGVYLTQLKPASSSRAQVARNNWGNTSPHYLNKTKNVFVLEIPEDEVKNVSTTTRDIFLFGGRKDLRLVKYKWHLQDFVTGKIIASHKYQLGSTGPAASSSTIVAKLMGDYVITEETVNGRPVYKQTGYNRFLYMSSGGWWVVYTNTDKDAGCLKQKDKYSLGPSAAGPWDYGYYDSDGKPCGWKGDDATLKAYPWYMRSTSSNKSRSTSSNKLKPTSSNKSRPISPNKSRSTSSNKSRPTSSNKSRSTSPNKSRPTSSNKSRSTSSNKSRSTSSNKSRSTSPNKSRPTSSNKSRSTSSNKSRSTSSNKSRPTSSNKSRSTSSNKSMPTSPNKSRSTSSNMPDPDRIDNGPQSPGTTRTGSVHGGPAGKTTGLRRRFVSMFQRLGKNCRKGN